MARAAVGSNDSRSPAIGAPTFTAGVTYSGALKVDIWTPGARNRPAVILLHGGGWTAGDKGDVIYATIAHQFAEKGFAVFNANYTLGSGAPQIPITDVLNLVAWVRTNATTYNADSTRVAIVGLSAGAHLGVMAGIKGVSGTTKPDAVAAWSLPSDLEEAYSQGNGPAVLGVGGYLNVAVTGNEELYRGYSPAHQITSACCPLRLVHSDSENYGLGDPGLAVAQYTLMLLAADSVGVSVSPRLFVGSTVHSIFTKEVGNLNVIEDYNGTSDDVGGTAKWIIDTLGAAAPTSTRTVSGGRTVATRTVADSGSPPAEEDPQPGTGVDSPLNQPAGMTQIFSRNFNTVDFAGWITNDDTGATIETDATAPATPSSILRTTYPAGFAAGESTVNLEYDYSAGSYKRIYALLYLRWSANFQGEESGTNKVFFEQINSPATPSFFFSAEGVGAGTLEPTLRMQGVPDSRDHLTNNRATPTLVRNQWHRLEVELFAGLSGGSNGEARMWWDGTLCCEHTDIQWVAAGGSALWKIVNYYPIWGGTGANTVIEEMYIDIDHFYMSGRTS